MDMNRTFFAKNEQKPKWRVVDAQGMIVGRLATKIADMLRGKDKAIYTPHAQAGDYVIVINADKVVFTGNKWEGKIYYRYSGWIGGLKETTAAQMLEKHPDRIVESAVRGMLPKNKIIRQHMRRLLIYAGAEHPHKAQVVTSAQAA